ncbi:hypothetical protein Ahy_A07g036726 [Arachis hypogaea]|uniref:MULE transposase domain-containing protein n=1 Tax=Arachis hypogaea TaxID=3818 RepID=A0A445CGX2_ARAHY|nr:hypothetical protein Ahy_A07g036726 [Arachis hypogaea]
MTLEEKNHFFKMIFVSRSLPFFGLDGCHLKVEAECRVLWSFFLNCLYDALGDDHYTIMSDKQKGLTRAISEYFPNSWHRHCSKYLLNNFKAKYPLLILQDLFWMAVKTPNEFIFKKQ